MSTIVCKKCNRELADTKNFYPFKSGLGFLEECKRCMGENYDPEDFDGFQHLLKAIDIPFIEKEWRKIYDRHKNDSNFTFASVFGRYSALMKGPKYKDRSFDGNSAVKGGKVEQPETLQTLDEGDRAYLIAKWGTAYSMNDLIYMENMWNEMMDSYDIRSASHKDYLKKICKASLRTDQAIDMGDEKAFKEYTNMYDKLMKSASFTEAQQKEHGNNFIDSFGEFFALLEEKGFIEPEDISVPRDVVDATIKNLNAYTKNLVMNEAGLGEMTEEAIRKMLAVEQAEEGEIEDDELDYIIPGEKDADDFGMSDFQKDLDNIERKKAMMERMESRKKKTGGD